MKALDISNATASEAWELLKALSILLHTTVRRSTVDQEDIKPYLKSEKWPHFFRLSTSLLQVFQRLYLLQKEDWQRGSFSVDLSSKFLNTGLAMRPSNNLENKTLLDTYSRVQLIRGKV